MNTNPDNRHIAYIIYFYVYLPYTSLDGMRESADVRKAREVEFGNLKSASRASRSVSRCAWEMIDTRNIRFVLSYDKV